MLSIQKPSGDKFGLGFNSFEASTSWTKETKFVKSQNETSSGGGTPKAEGSPHNTHTAPKANQGPSICLGINLLPDEWIKDSRCSKHMTGNQKLFSTYKAYNEGNVIFGSNLRGKIIDKGQIYDNKGKVIFSKHDSAITKDEKFIDYLTKFDPKSYEGVFLGYSQNTKAYIIINKHTMKVEESLNVPFDETPPPSKTSPLVDDDLDEDEAVKVAEKKVLDNDIEDEALKVNEVVNIKESKIHPLGNSIRNLKQRTLSWIIAMQEELNQFVANDVWELVPHPNNTTIIGTKWAYRNKLNENSVVSRNKVRLVAQGYNKQKGIDYDETYALVEMDDLNITMEEYIELESKKARRHGQTFNWETSTYGKVKYCEDIDYFKDFETNFPTIVYKDALASDHEISSKPTVSPLYDKAIDFEIEISSDESDDEDYTFIYDENSFSYKLISINDLKSNSENDNDEINISSKDIVIEPSDNVIIYNIDANCYEFDNNFETNHDIHLKFSK
nr:hypothetical protein [Tanacetum cinerariifolium]